MRVIGVAGAAVFIYALILTIVAEASIRRERRGGK